MPASSLKQYDDFGEMQNSLNSRNRFPDNPYSSDILYPNVAGFPDARLANGGTDRFTGIDLANLISNELVTSFLNGRSINLDNITSPIAQGILGGNTGIGRIQTALETSQSKFGVGGDFIRDALLKSTRLGNNTTADHVLPLYQPRRHFLRQVQISQIKICVHLEFNLILSLVQPLKII